MGEVAVDRRVLRTRDAVLRAAREVLLRDGWEQVTLARVAEHSGHGRATMYRHWPNRLDLLEDVIREEARLTHATPCGDLRLDLIAELDSFREAITTTPLGHVVIAIAHQARTDPHFAELNQSIRTEGVRLLTCILSASRDRGDLAGDVDVDGAVSRLLGPMLYQFLFGNGALDREQVVVSVVDAFLAAP